jgi:hypothetical protein
MKDMAGRDSDYFLDAQRLARLETKVDLVLDNQKRFGHVFDRHDERLKQLETAKSSIYGVAAAIAAMSAWLFDSARHLFHR